MIIAETHTFHLGRYTVQQRPRPDNPAWAVFIVFLGDRFIGKSFSMLDEPACRWLERQDDLNRVVYSDPPADRYVPLRGATKERHANKLKRAA